MGKVQLSCQTINIVVKPNSEHHLLSRISNKEIRNLFIKFNSQSSNIQSIKVVGKNVMAIPNSAGQIPLIQTSTLPWT